MPLTPRSFVLAATYAAAGLMLAAPFAEAQDLHPSRRLSPVGLARATLADDGTYVSVGYGRPYERRRDLIFGSEEAGALVPYGERWRMGANEATEITLTGDLTVGGEPLAAGTYSLTAVPGPEVWRLHFNSLLGLSGTARRNPESRQLEQVDLGPTDVLVITAPVRTLAQKVDPFSIVFKDAEGGVDMCLKWITTEVCVPLRPVEWSIQDALVSERHEATPSAEEILSRSIAHHDPDGSFLSQAWCLSFRETRPQASDRRSEILVDVPGERFQMKRQAEHNVAGTIDGELCEMTLDGRRDLSEAERQEHNISCQRLRLMQSYYVYLWGLPMKLRDPGTHLGEVETTDFMGQPVYGLRVTYDLEVGEDIWYFYFDRQSAALVGYRFYHDEAKNDGEYIVLTGEHEAHGMRLPASRAWYTHQGDRHLGTDILEAVKGCDQIH